MEKLIITAAITGSRITREITPHIPLTPKEIVQSAYKCWQAGAEMVKILIQTPTQIHPIFVPLFKPN